MQGGAVGLQLFQHARLLGLALHEEHSHYGRDGNSDKNDAEGAKGPSKVEVRVEEVGNLGAGERNSNSRSAVDAKHDHAVPQRGHVGKHDIDNEHHTKVTNVVERVRRHIRLHVLASGFHDHSNNGKQNHDEEALRTTPDIDDFGNDELAASREDGRKNADDVEKTVLLERGRNEGVQGALD